MQTVPVATGTMATGITYVSPAAPYTFTGVGCTSSGKPGDMGHHPSSQTQSHPSQPHSRLMMPVHVHVGGRLADSG